MPRDLPEVAVFASGRYASAWDADGKPIAWSEWTDADLQRMAENDAELRRPGQPAPYVKPSHDAEPVPGFVGPLRYAAGKLYACIEKCADWLAEQILAGTRPWRSAEILRDGRAVNFHGVTGPVFKGLAALNTHPRVKTLDSAVYADTRFAEPSTVEGSLNVVTFQEATMPTADQVLAALKALGMDDKLLKKVLDALGLSTAEGGAAPAKADGEGAAAAAPMAQMSDEAARRLVAIEAENKLLRSQILEDRAREEGRVKADRSARVARFADEVSLGYGAARAEQVKAVVVAKVAALPALEVFDEHGSDRLDGIFSEIKALMGPATVRRAAGAVVQAAGVTSVGGTETFSEENARAAILAEANPKERAWLTSKNPDATKTLATAIARRKAAHDQEHAV